MKYLITVLFLLPIVSFAECFDVGIKVQDTKQEGKWDFGWGKTKPEIALCIHDSLGYRCKLDAGNPDKHKSLCKSGFNCEYKAIYFPDQEYTLEIVDLDPKYNDRVGKKKCKRGERCLVGVAEVNFVKTECLQPVE
ncbi:hypothetical protein ACEK07_22740 [Alcanivoracaceae bacterium MT1]